MGGRENGIYDRGRVAHRVEGVRYERREPLCIRKPYETLYHRSSHWADPVESMNSLLALLGEPRSHSRWLLPPAAAINAISHWIMHDPQVYPLSMLALWDSHSSRQSLVSRLR